MNQINAVIKSIETEDNISLVVVQAAGTIFHTLVIDNQETADYLQEGKAVVLVFKENTVSIAKNITGQLSIRNRIPCTVSKIELGNVLSSITLDSKGHLLTSFITTHAVKELNLMIGETVDALIKTTDISLQQPEA